ncbi:MAG: hypothetical protein MI807_10870 [Verrucomicrobiales bacterium]|nr:hypothetical protein [Verrucomicrobiales bacterium]
MGKIPSGNVQEHPALTGSDSGRRGAGSTLPAVGEMLLMRELSVLRMRFTGKRELAPPR